MNVTVGLAVQLSIPVIITSAGNGTSSQFTVALMGKF
jgi:hypothetical protein